MGLCVTSADYPLNERCPITLIDAADKSFLNDLRLEWTLPDVIAERCVHSRMETASCRRCVEVCPQHAWVIDDDRLGIDADACDGCRLCAAVCPEQAIVNEISPEVRTWNDESVAFAACEFAGVGSSSCQLPCLHTISVSILVQLRREGVGRLMVARGDCPNCHRNGEDSLQQRVGDLNRLLVDRGLNSFPLVDVPTEHWRGLLRMTESGGSLGVTMGRRSFLRMGVAEVVDKGVGQLGMAPSDDEFAVPPGRLIPRRRKIDLSLFVPQIDPGVCDGCDACVAICPHGAISYEDSVYRLVADSCTGCGACVDICVKGAISVLDWARPKSDAVPLLENKCASCGVSFHLPRSKAAEDDVALCRICRNTNHQSKLFQVLD